MTEHQYFFQDKVTYKTTYLYYENLFMHQRREREKKTYQHKIQKCSYGQAHQKVNAPMEFTQAPMVFMDISLQY